MTKKDASLHGGVCTCPRKEEPSRAGDHSSQKSTSADSGKETAGSGRMARSRTEATPKSLWDATSAAPSVQN